MSIEDLDRDVRLHIYRTFVDNGRPPVPMETAVALERLEHEVEASYRRLHDKRAIVLAGGSPYVFMANPLCALPTPFRVEVDDRAWWGTCIWDALGVPAMLGAPDATIRTRCADCGEPLVLDISDGEIPDRDWVLHFAVPARHWWDDIGFN